MFSENEIVDIVTHMNEDHTDAVITYARVYTRFRDITWARMVTVDASGFDVICGHAGGSDQARISFKNPLQDKTDVRTALIQLVQEAREIEKSRNSSL